MLSIDKGKQLPNATIQELMKRMSEYILAHSSPSRIIFFGSAAYGTMREGSDLDVAVIFEDGTDVKLQSQQILRNRTNPERPADFLFYSETDFSQRSKIGGVSYLIATEGLEVYNKESGLTI